MLNVTFFRKNWFKGLLLLLGVINIGILVFAGLRPDQLEHIYFLNVGQGDATLIKTVNNHYILIDGGPDDSVISQIDSIMPPWHRQLDLVVLTHPHADHATGLLSVLSRYQVNQFWYTGTTYNSETYQALVASVTAKQIPIQLANRGDNYVLDDTNLRVIFPIEERPIAKDTNETSVVGLLNYQGLDVLFTGDASANNEKAYVSDIPDVDVIKVPHHGSQTASSPILVNQARSEMGVISVGSNNSFGHPHPDTVAHYESLGVKLYRTDEGMVELITDGKSYQVYQR